MTTPLSHGNRAFRPWTILALAGLIVSAFTPARAHAQSTADLLRQSRTLIDLLEIDSAGTLLRVVLRPESDATRPQRIRGLVLLGISELIQGRQFPARQAFRQALALDTSLEVDSLAELASDLMTVFEQERTAAAPPTPGETGAVLRFENLPPGARYTVDNVPWSASSGGIEPGRRTIHIEAPGYQPTDTVITVRAGSTVDFDVRMTALEMGSISVSSEPWGTVYVDNRRIGETPLIEYRLPTWDYTVSLEVPGQPRIAQDVTVPPAENIRVPMSDPNRASRSAFPFTAADSLFREAHFDEARSVYERIWVAEGVSLTDAQRALAAWKIGLLLHARGRSSNNPIWFDSSRVYFRSAFRLYPSLEPPVAVASPEAIAAYDLARDEVLTVNVVSAVDTIVPLDGALAFRILPTRRSTVTIDISDAQNGTEIHTETTDVAEAMIATWPLRLADGSQIEPGLYAVRVQAGDESGDEAPTVTLTVNLTREAVDTIVHPPPLAAALLLPESKPTNKGATILRGITYGLFTALALPAWSTIKQDDEDRPGFNAAAFAVGGAISLASILGATRGPDGTPLPDNIERNRLLREEDAANRQRIIEQNLRSRTEAGYRATVERLR